MKLIDKQIDSDQVFFEKICSLLLIRKDIDFSLYKPSTIQRRIYRRMGLLNLQTLSFYYNYLVQNLDEQDFLFQDLLIPVTRFFRDSLVFDHLKEKIFPNIFKVKSENDLFRVWIAGCSTGQEAYSLAITLLEYISTHQLKIKVQILATDISEKYIQIARKGSYLKKELKDVSEERLQKFFTKKGESYLVNKELRDLCVFANHNFIKNTSFSKMDLISCRNVLIYMDVVLQNKAFKVFHYALKDHGYLLLGKSESVLHSDGLFNVVDKSDKFYSKTILEENSLEEIVGSNEEEDPQNDLEEEVEYSDWERRADELLQIQFVPPGLILNENGILIQVKGNPEIFFKDNLKVEMAKGDSSSFIHKDLIIDLKNAFNQAKSNKERSYVKGVSFIDGTRSINIEVIPFQNIGIRYFIVLFTENFKNQEAGQIGEKKSKRIQQLEKELKLLKSDLHILSERQEVINEELQNANEELLMDSESLQSLNEELEISSEELQSANEELLTINEEILERNEQLFKSRKFNESILATIHEPFLLIDDQLRVLNANRSFYKVFHLNESDCLGESLNKIEKGSWDIPELSQSISDVLNKNESIINLEIDHVFPVKGLRKLCFNIQSVLSENEQDLILLAIEDITETMKVRQAEVILRERRTFYNFFMQTTGAFCILKGKHHVFEFANPSYCELVGNRNPTGQSVEEAIPELIGQGFVEILDKVYQTGEPYIGKEMPAELLDNEGNLKKHYLNFNFESLRNSIGEIEGVLVFAYDITEEVLAKSKIEESERKYRELIANLPLAVYTCDADGHIQIYNDAAVRLWGRQPKENEKIWEGSWQMFTTDGTPLKESDYPARIALKENRIINPEIITESVDGKRFNVISYPQIIRDEKGEVSGAIDTLIDVTERKKAERAKEQNLQMMYEMYRNSPAFVCILRGREYRYEFINPTYQSLYGNKDLVGKVLRDVHPELENQKIYQLLDNVYDTGTTYVATEMPLYLARDEAKGPEEVFLNFSYQAVYNHHEEIDGVLVFGYDVTKQVMAKKEKEEDLKQMLEFLPVMIWTNRPDGYINFMNKKWFEFTGIEDINSKGWKWRNLIHPDDILKTIRAYRKALYTGKPLEVESRFKKANDTSYRWHLNQALPIYNRENEIELWIGTATDIHEQKMKEQKKDEFISIASHEMKTPLTTAKAYLQLLQQTLGNDERKAEFYAEKASLSVEKLHSLISELLSVSKIQHGKLDFQLSNFDFNELLDSTIESIQYSKPKQKIIKSGQADLTILADKEKIQRVIVNLLSNAIKYSPDTEEVLIHAEVTQNQLLVWVKDKGIGISKENLERIFDRYYRVAEHAVQFQGLGIGLFISKEIMKLHKGDLWAESELGKGTIFYFSLPIV